MIRFDFDTKNVLASEVKCRKVGPSRLATNLLISATKLLQFNPNGCICASLLRIHEYTIYLFLRS